MNRLEYKREEVLLTIRILDKLVVAARPEKDCRDRSDAS